MRQRRGSVTTQTVLMLPVIVGAAALAVDLGYIFMTKSQARAVADMAVVAAGSVYQENETEETAQNRAKGVAATHYVGTVYPALENEDIIWGWYDGSSVDWTVDFEDSNAVKVIVNTTQSSFFSRLWGNENLEGGADSSAIVTSGPAGAVECFLPIALPHCNYPVTPVVNPPPYFINMGDSAEDNMGWAHPVGVNKSNIEDELRNLCNGNLLAVGNGLPVGNGVINPVINYIAGMINGTKVGDTFEWDLDNFPSAPPPYQSPPDSFAASETLINPPDANSQFGWGNTLQGPIALVDIGGQQGDCSGADNWVQNPEILGFTYAIIYDARLGSAATKGFMIQVDFVNEYDFGIYIDPDAIGNVNADSPAQLIL